MSILMSIIVILNCVISIIYFIYIWRKKQDLGQAILGTTMILCSMGFGAMFLFFSHIWFYVVIKRYKGEIDLKDISFSKEKDMNYALEDTKVARDKVPIQESVMVSNTDIARSYLLNILRDNYKKYIEAINYAAGSQDSEVSHYAATALVDNIARFKSEMNAVLKEEEIDKPEEIIEASVDFLSMNILSKSDRNYYTDVLEKIAYKTNHNDKIIYCLVKLYLHQNQNEQAKKWLIQLDKCQEKTINTYKAKLHYYFKQKEKEQFMQALEELKKSSIALDQQTLDLVRMFN